MAVRMHAVRAFRRRLLTLLLLPALALRVLVPAGFMPVVEGGELRMAVCPDAMHLPASSHGNHGLGHHGGDDDQPPARGMGKCPFANAASSAPPLQFAATLAMPAPAFAFLAPLAEGVRPSAGPPRETAARAPPFAS